MTKSFYLVTGIIILLSGCQKFGNVSIEALNTLAQYEDSVYDLQSIAWEGKAVSRTRNVNLYGRELFMQLSTLSEYNSVRKDLHINRAVFSEKDNCFYGEIELSMPIQSYAWSEEDSHERPSELTYERFFFSNYFISFSYKVDNNGLFTVTDSSYIAPDANDECPYSEMRYLDCTIKNYSENIFVVEFPEYCVPDFRTDTFVKGKVTMTYTRQ